MASLIKIEMLGQRRQVIGVVIHVVSVPAQWLALSVLPVRLPSNGWMKTWLPERASQGRGDSRAGAERSAIAKQWMPEAGRRMRLLREGRANEP